MPSPTGPSRGPSPTRSRWRPSGSALATLLDRLARHPSEADLDRLDGVGPYTAAGAPRYGLPAELPGFRGIREVGRGGMGTVYRAEQRGLDRPVALKILSEGLRAAPGLRERFNREVLALARLRHPNVVQIHDVDEYEGLPFLVMEWVEGGDLARRLRDGPLPVREAAEIALPLARAVQAAHDQGIIHRDLKPGNVLLSVERRTTPPGAWPDHAEDQRLRPGEAGRGGQLADADRRAAGDAQLHGPGADRAARRLRPGPGHRHLWPGHDPVRDARRPPAVRRQLARGDDPPGRRRRGRPAPPAAARTSRATWRRSA